MLISLTRCVKPFLPHGLGWTKTHTTHHLPYAKRIFYDLFTLVPFHNIIILSLFFHSVVFEPPSHNPPIILQPVNRYRSSTLFPILWARFPLQFSQRQADVFYSFVRDPIFNFFRFNSLTHVIRAYASWFKLNSFQCAMERKGKLQLRTPRTYIKWIFTTTASATANENERKEKRERE